MLNEPIKIDLHIHSAASQYKEPRGLTDNCVVKNCGLLLEKLISNDIALFSITDHNRFDADLYRAFRGEIKSRSLDLGLLAGVEFDVTLEEGKPSCHIITIFDAQESDYDKIKATIDADILVGKGDSYSREKFESLLKSIGLSTILIVHQHSGFGGQQRSRSLGSAADKGIDYYKYGYIDALEYNRPNVQGILRNELARLDLPPRMLIGSDCHDWNVYPKHDPKASNPVSFCAQVKALPTFKGLLLALTSPETRIGSFPRQDAGAYLHSVRLCGKDVELSPGINVIIGENGIGKSSLLRIMAGDTKRKWIKDVMARFNVECASTFDPSRTVSISQGQLQGKYEKGEIFEPGLFEEPSHQAFEGAVDAYVSALKRFARENVARRDRQEDAKVEKFHIDAAMEGPTFHFTCTCSPDFDEVDNKFSDRRAELKLVIEKISEECEHSEVYSDAEIKMLKSSLEGVRSVYKIIDCRCREKDAEARVKGLISAGFKEYASWLTKRSSDVDNDVANYRRAKSAFSRRVISLARDKARGPATIEELRTHDGWGESRKTSHGFSFVKNACYSQTNDITGEFFSMFNRNYKSKEAWEKIDTLAALADAIPRASEDDWEEKLDAVANKFKSEQKKCVSTILDTTSKASGSTLGEMSLTYFKYKTSTQASSCVFVVDQPEDNISNKGISGSLVSYFNDLRLRNQVVIVTHNPLLVVNQDVDNVIVLKNGSDGEPAVSFGCLESEADGNILDDVAELMDGGRDAIRKRVKAYEA